MPLQTLKPSIPCASKPSIALHLRPLLRCQPARPGPADGNRSGLRFAVAKGRYDGLVAGNGDGEVVRVKKGVDLATLGNLCVDIVLDVPSLPPVPRDERFAYMQRLEENPPDKKYWEAGGNCNLTIAAARLGLRCVTLGHVGDEIYGHFLLDVLQDEGIGIVGMNEDNEVASKSNTPYATLLCWVLVDPFQNHGFCSRADFSDEPAFSWMRKISEQVKIAIRQSRILFCNGYAFDELYADLISSAVECAIDAGTAIFFDPGPRIRMLLYGTPEQQRALELFLRFSDVLLFTSDEVECLTGISDPIRAGQELIKKGDHTKWVIIKMGFRGSIMITKSSITCAPAFKVNVVDTVGCGDSFTSAVALGFLHGMPPVDTLALANAVGAATAMGCGAGRNVADLDTVLNLLNQASLNEDDHFWRELIDEHVETPEIAILSRKAINGLTDNRLAHIPVQNVVSGLLEKLFDVHGRHVTVV